MIGHGSIGNRRARDGGEISNHLLETSSGYRFNLGQTIVYRGRHRRFGLGIHRGPWSFFLTLMSDVHEDLIDYFKQKEGREPEEAELAVMLKQRRLDVMPPLVAVVHREGKEPYPPRGVPLEAVDGTWFLRADRAGWPWRVHQSRKLLKRVLDELQGKGRR